jgi:hypothetical protein
MAQWILKENGKVVPQPTLRCLSPAELAPTNEVKVEKQALFNTSICGRLSDSVTIPNDILLDNDATETFDELWDLEPYEDDHETKFQITDADLKDAAGKPFDNKLLADTLINAEVLLPNEDSQAIAWVVRQATNKNGRLIGTFHENPLLNTLLYEFEFDDGTTREYAANIIASNIFMESDADSFSSLSCIILWILNVQGRPPPWPTSTSSQRLVLNECTKRLWDGSSWSSGPMAHNNGLN